MAKAKKKGMANLSEAKLRKKYGASGKAADIVVSAEDMLWIPSRFIALNYLTGGGLPFGKIVEIYGEESAGKLLLAFDFAYCTQALGGIVLWADAEYAFTREWALLNGLDLDMVELFQEKSIEVISDWSIDMARYYRSILPPNVPILLVVDSIAALDTQANQGVSQIDRKAEMGNRAKAMDTMLRSRNGEWDRLGVTTLLINQLRSKIGASNFEDPDTTPGGKATKYYASIRIGVYGGKQIKGKINGKDDRVGRVSSIRIKKNKVAPPRPTIKSAEVYTNPEFKKHDIGFNKYFNIDEVLERTGVLSRKKGASRFMMGDKPIANGKDKLLATIKKDDKLRRKLLRKSGINTISATRKKIEALGNTNIFKIDSDE